MAIVRISVTTSPTTTWTEFFGRVERRVADFFSRCIDTCEFILSKNCLQRQSQYVFFSVYGVSGYGGMQKLEQFQTIDNYRGCAIFLTHPLWFEHF